MIQSQFNKRLFKFSIRKDVYQFFYIYNLFIIIYKQQAKSVLSYDTLFFQNNWFKSWYSRCGWVDLLIVLIVSECSEDPRYMLSDSVCGIVSIIS